MDKKTNNQNIAEVIDENDEINFLLYFNFLLRNKIVICSFSIVSFIIFTLFAFTKRKTWEGQFQIVLDGESKPSVANSFLPADIAKLTLSGNNTSLNTEVGILKSQYVLMPIFKYVENKKRIDNPKIDLKFKDWKNGNLEINLEQDSSILNIFYTDQDKKIIIPVLEKIIDAYQEYSGKNKRRELKLTKDYLEEQIKIYSNKSLLSLKQAQEFAIEQDLNYSDQITINTIDEENPIPTSLVNGFEIELKRVTAANKIRTFKAQIKRIEELGGIYSEESSFFLTKILASKGSPFSAKLLKIDDKLVNLRSKYTENDPEIIRTIKERRLLLDLIKDIAVADIKSDILSQQAVIESTTRPKGVLLTYKELMRLAQRDEFTLVQLENSLRSINLESAKLEDPWQLISEPTLTDYPIAPTKRNYAYIGIIFGLFSGIIWCFIKEKKSDLVFDYQSIENILGAKIIEKIELKNKSLNLDDKSLLINTINISEETESYKLLLFNNISNNIFKKFEKKFIIENSINSIKDEESIILLMSFNMLKLKDIKSFKNKLNLLNKNLSGIILIIE